MKTCEMCGIELKKKVYENESNFKKRKCCSQSCGAKLKWIKVEENKI